MNRQKKQFIALVIVTVIAIALLCAIKIYNNNQEEKAAADAEAEKINAYTIDIDDITSVSYLYEDNEITLKCDGDSWVDSSDDSIDLDEDAVEEMLGAISEITANDVLTDIDDLSEYGLDNTENIITVTTESAQTKLYFGNQNEFTDDYYMMVDGSDNVYTVDESIFTAFSKSVEDLTVETETEE